MSIYLDFNATTPLESSVVGDIVTSLNVHWGNPSSCHRYGRVAKTSIEKARKNLSKMIHGMEEDIIFTSGGTEANNMVIYSALETYRRWKAESEGEITISKPHYIATNVEHDATNLPLKHLENRGDIEVSFVPVGPNGCVDTDDIISSVKANTCLITVMFANNETGVVMPIADIGRQVRKINQERKKRKLFRILYHTDAAQAIGKIPVNVDETMVDYLTVVGHKV
ncbi:hypothetical protein J437_LFUL001426 [Ladona fulva]|uniref:Selenocysteine lyase n=1 Tax=Ladona fulva TaxID=123851 RepID=A0A8K0NUA3_LADFU|nr:hypothetical protein J437_LFUL001426 [Ladona fulva]